MPIFHNSLKYSKSNFIGLKMRFSPEQKKSLCVSEKKKKLIRRIFIPSVIDFSIFHCALRSLLLCEEKRKISRRKRREKTSFSRPILRGWLYSNEESTSRFFYERKKIRSCRSPYSIYLWRDDDNSFSLSNQTFLSDEKTFLNGILGHNAEREGKKAKNAFPTFGGEMLR